jgi:hypothetical protein
MFEWRVNLDDDAVFDLLTTLERAIGYHGADTAVGKEHKRISDDLRNAYACFLHNHAEQVRHKWAKEVE